MTEGRGPSLAQVDLSIDRAGPMRRNALLLLVLMAGVFILARYMHDQHMAWGFVEAFAEAAMVGGLADWFAVTALFRHPLGIPIPHTAIVPNNKDRIGDTLAVFLKENFLTPQIVARRMKRLDVAETVGRFLTDPKGGEGRMRQGVSKLAIMALENLDDAKIGGTVKTMLSNRIRKLDLAPVLGQSIDTAMEDNRHAPIIDSLVHWAANILDANENIIRGVVYERANRVLRWLSIDETLANAIIKGLRKLLAEMEADPHHPLRAQANEGFVKLAFDLQHDAETQAKVEQFKMELLDNPAVSYWLDGMWHTMRKAMIRAAEDPDRLMAGQFGEAVRELGHLLQNDEQLKRAVNSFSRRAVVGAIADYGDSMVGLISETVRSWDAETVTARVENAVGRDLQFIRINGTLVGGLVGLVIHTIVIVTG